VGVYPHTHTHPSDQIPTMRHRRAIKFTLFFLSSCVFPFALHIRSFFFSLFTLLSFALHFAFENLQAGHPDHRGPPSFRSVFPPPLVVGTFRVFTTNTPRLAKEQKLYAQENQDQKLKLDKFIANNADEWDIKNGVRHSFPSSSLTGPSRPHAPALRTCAPSILMLISSKQKRMLEESERMIEDTDKRLGAAVQVLRDLIVGFTSPPSIFLPTPHVVAKGTI
jgi:tubulin-specific chaperone A